MTQTTPWRMRQECRGLSGIGAGTPVMTPGGPVAAGRLRAGDRVITFDAGAQRLAHVSASDLPVAAMLRISPVVLTPGDGAPDMLVAAGQMLLVRGWRARAMFGRDAALVAAARMADGAYIAPVGGVGTARLITLGFAGAARIVQLGGGIEVQGACVTAPAMAPPTRAR
ncbi:Hint domain-containing protein [Maritimibacter fusiformis]|uniref:Hedgehog/Intein (Hint) domain-containing protein n=1 Tax=Maritimibacter fusiformis TaxID=2603819 RepID=A0A5D0RMN3_9RHOB|nr:Hint domain-containing protein [Maritimibacter fusiformis]TYB82792.1 hypothetical protein FVF75_00990 [Maritimibacter fusiformis]